MLKMFRQSLPLLGALFCSAAPAQVRPAQVHSTDIDVAVTYVAERGKIAPSDCGCFWLQGGSLDTALTFYRGLGVAANLTGGHNDDIASGVELDKVAFMLGPRYTVRASDWWHRGTPGMMGGAAIFGEGLIGGVHSFNTVVPTAAGTAGAASSFAFQVGGGVDVPLGKRLGIRLVEADFVRSTLPNGGNDVQHDLRLAAGISFHLRP